jgi:hypothetical protein
LFRAVVKNQGHSIAGRDFDETILGRGFLELIRTTNGLVEPIDQFLLFVGQRLGIADNVEKQDMNDLQFYFPLNIRRNAG